MSIINALRVYLVDYGGLVGGAPLWVDYLGPEPPGYAIIPIAGGKIIERYLSGRSLREFHFAFRSAVSTADDLERIENSGFFEALGDWMESQSEAGDLPDLGAGKTPELIEAVGWGYLYEQGQSDTGIYQILCRLTYVQDAL